jgi:leucyl-tRNA synthetase
VAKDEAVADGEGGFKRASDGAALKTTRFPEEAVEKRGAATVLKAQPAIQVDARAHKMSKSRGNVINPDDVVKAHGADALRLFEMFLGPLEAVKPWSTGGIQGVARFLERSWALAQKPMTTAAPEGELLRTLHKTTRKVTEDIEALRFNTGISALMILLNDLAKADPLPKEAVELHVRLLHPFAPHLAEELWEQLGHPPSLQAVPWPAFDPALCVDDAVTIAVQVNGKLRGKLNLPAGVAQADAEQAAKADEGVQRWLDGKELVKTVWVPDKLLSFVVKG